MLTEIEQLYRDTQTAFDNSSIKKYGEENNLKWYYSVASTKLEKNQNLIIGFNWGAGNNHEPQINEPLDSFKDLYVKKDLGSLSRIYLPLKKYFPDDDIDNSVQTNFCFFRSKTEDEITSEDLKLSTPLFIRLVEIIKPKRIIGFSNKLRNYFIDNHLLSTAEHKSIPSNRRTVNVSKGILKGSDVKAFFLPHPNAKVTTVARNAAWEFCFNSNS